jgi:flavin reductase (DIM6/NTAB) family NADH-FMN oxidoreductase RutF
MRESRPSGSSPAGVPRLEQIRGDSSTLRRLFGSFATGVTVATALDSSGQPTGMTASAITAVSLDPPLLLVCVNRQARLHGALAERASFTLNVLTAGQQSVAERFASGVDDPFHDVAHQVLPEGIVLLEEAVAYIVCDSWDSFEAGDHTVFLGRIRQGAGFDSPPLIHFRSRYTTTV